MAWDEHKAEMAAGEAEKELLEMDAKIIDPICDWWNKYFRDAGHRRLGRILVSVAKTNEESRAKGQTKRKKKAS